MPPTPAQTPRRRGGSAPLDEVLPKDGGSGETPQQPAPPPETPPAPELPVLPEMKTTGAGVLEDKTVVIYGEAGIGKSTLASEWADGDMLFFDTAGELKDLEVYRVPVSDWTTFRAACAAYAKEMSKEKPRYRGVVIDTADMLGTFCAQKVRKQLGIAHESDADWGKGWTMVREEFASHIAKLAALPGGLILISHSKTVEIKRRNEAYDRFTPTLTGGVREAVINAADLVLFVDWADDDEGGRVIYTKPHKYHEAKERGRAARLPEAIAWPMGKSGYAVIRDAWDQ